MKKIEDKIIKRIYKYETSRTVNEVVWKILMITFFGFSGLVFISLIFDIYRQAGTFDLLNIFYSDNLIIFLAETPKIILFFSIMFIMLAFYKLISFIKNFKSMKKKLEAIINYWRKNI